MNLSEGVIAEIKERFGQSDAAVVITDLETTELPFLEAQSVSCDRVHLALLVLSAGNYSKFAANLKVAVSDWRDVLVASGLETENWREVLASSGWRIPGDNT